MGITFFSGDPVNNPLNLYNSAGSGGDDPDLEKGAAWAGGNIPNEDLGNLLIINTNDDIDDPNDNGDGGTITTISTMPLSAFNFDIVDLEEVELTDGEDVITFRNTATGKFVTVPFAAFEENSGTFLSIQWIDG